MQLCEGQVQLQVFVSGNSQRISQPAGLLQAHLCCFCSLLLFSIRNSHFCLCSNSGPRPQAPAFCSGKPSSEVTDPVELVCPCWMETPRADLRAWPWTNPGMSQGLGGLAAVLGQGQSTASWRPHEGRVCGQGSATPQGLELTSVLRDVLGGARESWVRSHLRRASCPSCPIHPARRA